VQIEVRGAAAKIDAIFRFDKTIWRDMQREVKDAAGDIAKEAGSNMPTRPLRNWGKWIEASGRSRNLWYEQSAARKFRSGFRSQARGGFREVSAIVTPSSGNAAGAIFLLAGSVGGTKSRHPAGAVRSANFKRALNRKHGGSSASRGNRTWPRVLSPLYYKHREQAAIKIGEAVQRAISKFNQS
jgi:hypothetical protein